MVRLPLVLGVLCLFVLVCCSGGARVSVYSSEKQAFYDNLVPVKRHARICPNSCSNHGSCSGGSCHCTSGWSGEDCSIRLKELRANTPIRDETVDYRTFNYYSIRASETGGLAYVVNSTGKQQPNDCDIFVKFEDLPTLHDYDQRDISVEPSIRLDVKMKGTGTYYLGVFGFTTCHYDVEAIVEGNDCPNGCSGHGECTATTQQCSCENGWGGDDCSNEIPRLAINTFANGELAVNQWDYYYFDMPSDYDAISFIVNQTSRSGDVDLYMKFGKLPTLTDWDEIDNSVRANFALTLDAPRVGRWYIGLYSFSAVSYRIRAQPFQDCTNDCSGASHGTCSTNGCTCKSGFTGDYCESMRSELADAQKLGGFVDDNIWNYYHYRSTTVDDLLVSVNQTRDEANPDCDVYVRSGSRPTFSDYDYRSIAFEDNVKITIEDGQFQTWYIGVFGFQACTYQISVTPTTSCIPGCKTHGTCLPDGSCRCNSGWSGEACDQQVTAITSAQLVSDTVENGEFKYYVLEDVNASYITVHMHEESTSGSIWLYVSQTEFPSLDRHDYEDRDANTAYHNLDITTGIFPGETNDFFIGVYGSPYLSQNQRASFKLEAWIPPF